MKIVFPNFPNSFQDPFEITSPETTSYNCIAWAFEDPTRWYWPDPSNIYYWPPGIPRTITTSSFIQLFELKGYQLCPDGRDEPGFIKIVIFTDMAGVPTHAARQLHNGFWTSKLGQSIDVRHSLYTIDGGAYGNISVFMRRPI
jgi:hypothetical protein